MEGQMEDKKKLLLNEREAAHLLSMSTHFLRRDRISTSSVGIPYLRIGAAIRYRRSDLEDWIERQMQV
jgi:predicted DNA-binding transcriptional regulator AlpA